MRTPETLTVKELIEELKNFDPKSPVYFAYNYGDYWKTEVASHIDTLDEEQVEWSEYHRMMKTVGEEHADEPSAQSKRLDVVIIR